MIKKNPKPRVNDSVERSDLERMFGVVKHIHYQQYVIVEWFDEKKPKYTKERPDDLSLVKRWKNERI